MQHTIDHELLVVSDVHLISEEDERGKLLLELLSHLDPSQVRYLVFLGDIFDFCLGASSYFQKKYSQFGKRLSALAEKGIRIYFVEGNHEFLLKGLAWQGVKFLRNETLILELSDGKKISFLHGDHLKAPWHYHLYSYMIRSALSRFFALRVPQKKLDQLALYISSKSRKHSYSREVDEKELLSAFEKWMLQLSVDIGIVGHFHTPYNVKLPGLNQRILGLDSWDKPNALTYHKGHFYRIYLSPTDYKILPLDHV